MSIAEFETAYIIPKSTFRIPTFHDPNFAFNSLQLKSVPV